jgi:hypothetical protein
MKSEHRIFFLVIVLNCNFLFAQSFYSVLESYNPPEGWTKSWSYDSTKTNEIGTFYFGTFILKNNDVDINPIFFLIQKIDFKDTIKEKNFIEEFAKLDAEGKAKNYFALGNYLVYEYQMKTIGGYLKNHNEIKMFYKSGLFFTRVKSNTYTSITPTEKYIILGNSLKSWIDEH